MVKILPHPQTRVTALILLLLVAAALLPHLPAWSAGFTYDDRDFVEQNASIRSLEGALEAFSSPFPPNQPQRGLYRPLTALSYALDHVVWGAGPAGFHRANLFYYTLTVLLLFFLLRRWLPGREADPGRLWAVVTGALLFAVHPVHTEAVDSISGRSELLALLFSLSALLLLERFLRETRCGRRATWLGLVTLCVLLAALSKETGAVTPALMAVRLLLHREGGGRRWIALLPTAAALMLYVVLRLDALEGAFGPQTVVMPDASLGVRLLTVGAVTLEYARLLAAPTTLQVDAYYERVVGVQQAASPEALAGLSLLLLLITLWLVLLRKSLKAMQGEGIAAVLGLSALLVYLLPISHLIPFGALMAERLLYAPSVGVAVLATGALAGPLGKPGWRRTLLAALCGGLLLLLAGRTYLRAEQWQDPITLWMPVVAALEDDHRAYNNLATGYIQRGDLRRAEQTLRRSLLLAPAHPRALNNLGLVTMRLGRLEEARRVLEALVAKRPRHFRALNNLGVIATRQGDNILARRRFMQSLKVNPNYVSARKNLTNLERTLARARRYLDEHRTTIGVSSPADVLRRYAAACFALGDYDCAKKYRLMVDKPRHTSIRRPR